MLMLIVSMFSLVCCCSSAICNICNDDKLNEINELSLEAEERKRRVSQLKHVKDQHNSNFKSHLEKCHSISYKKKSVTSSAASAQSTISFPNITKYNLNDKRQMEIDFAVANLFNSCVTVAFRVVEHKAFREMAYALNPQWNPMGRARLRQMTSEEYETWKDKIKLMACANKGFISVETDLWSDRRLRSYITLYGTFVTTDLKRKRFLIGFKDVKGSHNGLNIRSHYEQALSEVGLHVEDLVRTTTDNARNMLSCFSINLDGTKEAQISNLLTVVKETWSKEAEEDEDLLVLDESDDEMFDAEESDVKVEEWEKDLDRLTDLISHIDGQRISCFAHSLQLVVVDALNDLPADIRHAVAKANNVASVSHQVQAVADLLGNIPTPAKTRWNYQIRTIKAVLEIPDRKLEQAQREAVKSKRNINLTAGDITLLHEFVKLFQEFADVTNELQADDSFISQVVPSVLQLQRHTEEYISESRLLKKVSWCNIALFN